MAVGAGDRVGQYVLRREIGKGAMATVYEAEHLGLGKRVALKRMHPHLATDATGASRFLREGRAATQIRSPHVVEVFDVGKHDNVPYLVMELLDGVDLAAFLREHKRLAPTELADLMIPVACAVHAAHEAGVVHRDLKPSNILLAKSHGQGGASRAAPRHGRPPTVSPMILDFGISKLTSDIDHDLTASEVLLGTVHYMSPEQTRGGKKASAASDQYALGIMLYECLTGAKPFAGSTPYAVMHAIVSTRVPAPSNLDPNLPTALDAVVLRSMHRDPQARFPSVRALGAALLPWASAETRERYAGELGALRALGLVEPIVAAQGPSGSRRRRARVAIGMAIAAAIAVGAGALSLRSHGQPAATVPPRLPPTLAAPILPAAVHPPEIPAPTEAPPALSASAPSARATVLPQAATRASTSPSASSGHPERGTNGALIVE